jgi:hypothetical protein
MPVLPNVTGLLKAGRATRSLATLGLGDLARHDHQLRVAQRPTQRLIGLSKLEIHHKMRYMILINERSGQEHMINQYRQTMYMSRCNPCRLRNRF